MALDVNLVMDALGAALGDIDGIRVYDYQADSIAAPAVVVALPEAVMYDSTYARGCDSAMFAVHVLVGRSSDRASRDALGAYLTGTGPSSVKQALEVDPSLGGVAKSLRVQRATVSTMDVSTVNYLAASFDVEVYA